MSKLTLGVLDLTDEQIEELQEQLWKLDDGVSEIFHRKGTAEDVEYIIDLIVAIDEFRGFEDGDEIRIDIKDDDWDHLVDLALSKFDLAQKEYELTRRDHYANREPRDRLKAGFDDALIDVVADELQARYGYPDYSNSSSSKYWEFGRYKIRLSDHPLPTYYDLPTLDIRVAPQLDGDAHMYLWSPCTDEELEAFIKKVIAKCDNFKALAEAEEAEDIEWVPGRAAMLGHGDEYSTPE